MSDAASTPRPGGPPSLCIATVVFGAYREYIPYFIHSVATAYPAYAVKIFVADPEMPERVAEGLRALRGLGVSRFAVRPGAFPGFGDARVPVVGRNSIGKHLRWLLPPVEFAGFDYGYVGDIDFLILPESEPFLDGHVRHSQELGVPYSNIVRTGTRRLSGLHFFAVRPYFEATAQLIGFYAERPECVRALGLHNEEFLYHLIEQTIGFGAMAMTRSFRPKHGFHLGCVRQGNQAYVDRWRERPERRAPLTAYLASEGFRTIHRVVGNRDVDTLLRALGVD